MELLNGKWQICYEVFAVFVNSEAANLAYELHVLSAEQLRGILRMNLTTIALRLNYPWKDLHVVSEVNGGTCCYDAIEGALDHLEGLEATRTTL